jgi:hypothetical protein
LPGAGRGGPLEGYAARFDDLFGSLAQRRGFREYLAGLLAPRDRNKTLTALAGTEPVAGAQHPAVQRLQFFLSESRWDPEKVNERRLGLLRDNPATAPHGGGVLVLDDSGDRKDGAKTAHVGRQWLGRYGKTDNGWSPSPRCGPTSGSTIWCTRCSTPRPGTSRRRRTTPRSGPSCRSARPRGQAQARGVRIPRGGADCAYGDQDGFRSELAEAGLPFVMALKPRRGTWAYGADANTPVDAARELRWGGPDEPANGIPWCACSATGTPRPGGPPRRRSAGGGRTTPGAW